MKKNNSKLILAVIGMALILCLSAVFGPKLATMVNADTNLTDSYKITYQVESDDAKAILAVSEKLEKRLYTFGATTVETTVNGNQVTLHYNGNVDNDVMRANLARTGAISFRDGNDTALDMTGCLDESSPVSVTKTSAGTQINFNVDEEAGGMSKLYTTMALSNNTTLVIWVDYEEGQSYATENAKTSPAFLAAATINSSITSDFYILSGGDYNTLFNMAAIAGSGALDAAVKEVSFENVAPAWGANAVSKLLLGSWITVALASVYTIVRFKLSGVVNALMMIGYLVAGIVTVTYLDVTFSATVLVALWANLFVGLIGLLIVDNRLSSELASGHSARNSFDNAVKPTLLALGKGYGLEFIIAAVGYIAFNSKLSGAAITLMTASVLGGLFLAGWNWLMTRDLIDSNHFDKAMFGDNRTADTPVKRVKVYDLMKNNAVAYVFVGLGLIGAIACVVSNSASVANLTAAVITALAGIMIIGLLLLAARKNAAMATVASGVGALLWALTALLVSKDGDLAAFALTATGTGVVLAIVIVENLLTRYQGFGRGKNANDTVDEITGKEVNVIAAEAVLPACVLFVLFALISLLVLTGRFSFCLASTVMALGVVCTGVLLAAKLASDTFNKNRKTRKKAKKPTNELTERTVYGINNVK